MTEKKKEDFDLTKMLAKKDAERRAKGGKNEGSNRGTLPVTEEELANGLRFVDMDEYDKQHGK